MKLTKSEITLALNHKQGIDWGKLDSYPELKLLGRIASDYYYAEQISKANVNSGNDSLLESGLKASAVLGLTVPLVGGAILLINEILGGVNLNTFGNISKSGIASNRLKEWNQNMIDLYAMPFNNNLPLSNSINWFISRNNITSMLIPKCISPTSPCNTEHLQYQMRVSLMREAQESILKVYKTYIQTDRLREFEEIYNRDNVSNNNLNNTNVTKAGLSPIVGIALIGLFFGMKG